MWVIGILGGVASGKSLVTHQLQQLGAEIIDADRMGHETLRDKDIIDAIRDRWGSAVFDEKGNVQRSALASIVFAPPPTGPEQLAHLERITHPRIEQRLRQRIEQLALAADVDVVVLDAPVMLKAGWDRLCDQIIFVDAPRHLRLERAQQRGWDEAEFSAREAVQESLDVKRKRADFVIDNSGSREATCRQAKLIWQALRTVTPRKNSNETDP